MVKEKAKVKKENELHEINIETAFVGLGPATLSYIKSHPELTTDNNAFIVLESEDTALRRGADSALHLVSANEHSPLYLTKKHFPKTLVRWEREWVSPEAVDWSDKEWSLVLPQWNFYFEANKNLVEWNKEILPPNTENIYFSSPVNQIQHDPIENHWVLHAPNKIIQAKKVIWGAGIRAFQNAFGKFESQEYFTPNPKFNDDIRENLGGLALNWYFDCDIATVEGFPRDNIWALPVKHDKKYYLCIGVLSHDENNCAQLRTLTYLPDNFIQNPKELSSFHKSLKRSLKAQLERGVAQRIYFATVIAMMPSGRQLKTSQKANV
jgi:hypothetical protein